MTAKILSGLIFGAGAIALALLMHPMNHTRLCDHDGTLPWLSCPATK